MRLSERVAEARRAFVAAGIDPSEAAIDAEVLARHVLRCDRAGFLIHLRDAPPASFDSEFQPLVARRVRREPVAYIVGEREFWGRRFVVGPGVLVPRPETEFIVEEALGIWVAGATPERIIDVGTGSGCLAVTLALEFPHARITAIDTSPAALEMTHRNALMHGVADRLDVVEGDLLGRAPVADLIVSNPPYVPEGSVLPPEVLDYEPAQALFAGPDGMAVIRRLFADAPRHLAPGGHLIVEFGFGQDALVRDSAAAGGWTVARIRDDLQGIPRTAVLRR